MNKGLKKLGGILLVGGFILTSVMGTTFADSRASYHRYFSQSLTAHSNSTIVMKSLNAGTCKNTNITPTLASHLATIVSNDKKRDLSYTASIPRTQSNSIKKHQLSSNLGENAYQRYTVSKGGVTISGTFSH